MDRFLAIKLPEFSRSRLTELIDSGKVLVDGVAQKRSFRAIPGMTVRLDAPVDRPMHDLTPFEMPLEILFEDEHLLVVNKPRGLATHPAPTLKSPSLVNVLLSRASGLSSIGNSYRPGIIHRLDKETTGLLLVAKDDASHLALAKGIQTREIQREYLAIIARDFPFEKDSWRRIEAPIARDPKNRLKMAVIPGGKSALTHVRGLANLDAGTFVRCRLETGRTHQIRVHLAAIGYPVLGDLLYAPQHMHTAPLQLHAFRLVFRHPFSNEELEIEAPTPPDFLADPEMRHN
ncbi:MAG: RluA family pseudouridine synthase [Fimbriimonadaceae bacterium]